MSLSANFLTELDKSAFQGNIILDIDGTYFSQYTPDSGVSVDADKIGLILSTGISGTSVDLRDIKTSIASLNFSLLDKDGVISSFMGASATSLTSVEVKLYFGYITGSFDFADYALLSTTRVNSVSKTQNGYSFSAREAQSLLQRDLLNTFTSLDGAITDSATTITVTDTTGFPTSGHIKIDAEFMQYAGISGNDLTGVSRSDQSSENKAHDDNAKVSLVTEKEAHAMDIALDVIINDMGIDPALVDSDSFTDLRDGEFSGEADFTLYIYDNENALKWLEDNIFLATNTRLLTVDGIMTLKLLDQIPLVGTFEEITEDHSTANPNWRISSSKIVNKIIINWFWVEGTQSYARTDEITDTESEGIFDPRKALTLNFKGVRDFSIVNDRATRLLSRLSTPRARIDVPTNFNRLRINTADNVRLVNRYLPQQGGTLGFDDVLEVVSRSLTGIHTDAECRFTLEFSSYTGIRFGLIQPSPALTLSITDQKTFEVPDGACYEVGYRLKLWDNVNNLYFADAINEIESISGNIITMKNDWTTTLGSNVSIWFADYENASGSQRARYAFTAPNTNIFVSDSSKAYQIII